MQFLDDSLHPENQDKLVVGKVVNPDTMANPDSLAWYEVFAAQRQQ